ncbi:uncharacterized protein LOC131425380 [Malaya genurostris]|uniref:uncharacterized protein LOC131425380 n=1 Tax=Malaya genurostris TaxID=325434 RepID=UPI0026F3A981|nr:uncharacterized protein LOC131425380 [Malaya genurostris]
MTSFEGRLRLVIFVILLLPSCMTTPVTVGEAPPASKSIFKRTVGTTSSGDSSSSSSSSSSSDFPKIENEVAAFIESGRMNNDYVWIDVTTKKFVPIPGNDLEFGDCSEPGELIYFDNTVIENSGPSTLNGTLEIYIDAPVNITCVKAIDQIQDGTGGSPAYNSMGTNWAKIDVAGQYGKGFHFHIYVYGIRTKSTSEKDKTSKDSQSNLI